MSTCFNIEESYKRYCGVFNDLSKETIMNPNISQLLNKIDNKYNVNGRELHVIENDDDFINTIEVIGRRRIVSHEYITRDYYNKYKHIYNELFKYKLYTTIEYKQFETKKIEKYIYNKFKNRDILNNFDFKVDSNKEQIHGKINIDKLNFITTAQTKGTFIDYCIKYIINNNYDYGYSYLMSCIKSVNHDYDNLPENLENCKNTKELIECLFDSNFIKNILKLKEKFGLIKTTECYINFEYSIYGEPDLISDDYIIDIKTSENKKIDSKQNWLQTLFYTIVANKKNICLYDPINGLLYKYQLTNQDINDAINHIQNGKNILSLLNKKIDL